MSDVIFSSKLTPSVDKARFQKYFAIPVSYIKVIMTFSEKPGLNHFERAILSLLLGRYHTTLELSETLLLKNDLVELILNDLQKKEYIDVNNKVTSKGEDVLKSVYKESRTEACYLFFDHNRGCLISSYCNRNDIVFAQGRKYMDTYSFVLDKDAFKEEIPYKYIKTNNIKEKFNDDLIATIVKRDIFKKSEDINLVNVKIIDIDDHVYHFISSVETSADYRGTKWCVKNPITLENDEGLYDYFYNNSASESVKELILGVMNYRINQQDDKEISKMYEKIKKDLFNVQIKPLHEDFILPLIYVIKVLKESKDKNYEVRVHRNEIIKAAMINLGDLYEKVLYNAALASPHRDEYNCLSKDIRDNQIKLKGFAATVGFAVSENGEKLLMVNKKSIQRIIKDPNKAQLGECISWNLILSTKDSNFYMFKLAKKYPNFINLMYQFKRNYRDENKHSTNVADVSPKLFIDILFDILELAFGYIVKPKVLEELINFENTICDYSFTEEVLRSELGNKIFNSSCKEITELKFNLLSMYDAYVTENCKYLTYAYPILEGSIRKIVVAIQNKYKLSYQNINSLFSSNEELKKFLIDNKFNVNSNDKIGNNVIDSLEYIGVEQKVENGFKDGFTSSVLRVKLLSLIDMMKQNQKVCEEFTLYGLDDLFVITSSLSYLQGHQQAYDFNSNHARIIISGIIKLIDFMINKSELIKWN